MTGTRDDKDQEMTGIRHNRDKTQQEQEITGIGYEQWVERDDSNRT